MVLEIRHAFRQKIITVVIFSVLLTVVKAAGKTSDHDYEREITDMKKKMKTEQTLHELMAKDVKLLKSQMGHMKKLADKADHEQRKRLNKLESDMRGIHRKKAQHSQNKIAFSAMFDKTESNLPIGTVLKFPKVWLNVGNAYNPTTGVFTAPISGIYIFSYHMGLHGISESWIVLKKNSHQINGAAEEGTSLTQNNQGGNTAILHLGAKERVWLETIHVKATNLQKIFTTFSGALLRADKH